MVRSFFNLIVTVLFLASCGSKQEKSNPYIMTVSGTIETSKMGLTLEHEHIIVDFIGAEKIDQPQYPFQQAVDSLLPYYIALKNQGVQTFIDCTPNYIGRDVQLLKAISQQTGLHLLTNTGYYAAADKKFLPAHTYAESAAQLAERWIKEWEVGIDGTEIKPGFIKLGVGKNHLDSIEQKIVKAGALTHLATGLKIAIHTGSFSAANDEIDILKKEGVNPKVLIVVHSQNASSKEQISLIKRGAWVSLDGINSSPESIEKYTEFLTEIKKAGLLHKTLISQDAFWSVEQGENTNISFKRHGSSYSALLTDLISSLKSHGFNQADIDQLLIKNPFEAYKIEVCKMEE